MQKDFLSILDMSKKEALDLLDSAIKIKADLKAGKEYHPLKGKVLAMIFEKPSLRTRSTFEIGMYQLGGYAMYLAPSDIQLGKRESVPDVARNLSRWVNGVMARTFSHKTIVDLAENASVPVINALSDAEHPCQILADFQTIKEHKGTVEGLNLSFVGAWNNVSKSLFLMSALVGTNMTVACAKQYQPDENDEIYKKALELAAKNGVTLKVTDDPVEGVKDADVIYTDVWASMGEEDEKEIREKAFRPFQVNSELVSHAKKDHIILHCLPAHRGEEITSEVLDGPHSVVLDEAENRLHAQKALLVKLMG